jgi:hypothetical protein
MPKRLIYLITWNQWEEISRHMSSAAARVYSGYRLLSITKKPAVDILVGNSSILSEKDSEVNVQS